MRDMQRGSRPYWRSIRTYWYWFAVIALLAGPVDDVSAACRARRRGRPARACSPKASTPCRRVVDGDTLLNDNPAPASAWKDRHAGNGSQELSGRNWGPEASRFTKEFVKHAGGRVKLTFGNERLDKYGRYLAFVWDGEKCSTKNWSAPAWPKPASAGISARALKRRLRLAQEEAKRAKRGIWSGCAPQTSLSQTMIQ